MASSALGVPRTTLDADLVADLRFEHVERLAQMLEADYYADADMNALDLGYLRRWAAELGISDLLDRALRPLG